MFQNVALCCKINPKKRVEVQKSDFNSFEVQQRYKTDQNKPIVSQYLIL